MIGVTSTNAASRPYYAPKPDQIKQKNTVTQLVADTKPAPHRANCSNTPVVLMTSIIPTSNSQALLVTDDKIRNINQYLAKQYDVSLDVSQLDPDGWRKLYNMVIRGKDSHLLNLIHLAKPSAIQQDSPLNSPAVQMHNSPNLSSVDAIKSGLVNSYLLKQYEYKRDFGQLDADGQGYLLTKAIKENDRPLVKLILDAPSLKRQALNQQGFGLPIIIELVGGNCLADKTKDFALANFLLEQPGFPLGNQGQQVLAEDFLLKLIGQEDYRYSDPDELYYDSSRPYHLRAFRTVPHSQSSDQTGELLLKRKEIFLDVNRIFGEKNLVTFITESLSEWTNKPKISLALANYKGFDPSVIQGKALADAAEDGHLEVIKAILKTGKVDINEPLGVFGQPVLVFAVINKKRSYKETIEFLLAKGADVNKTTNGEKNAPLHLAAMTRLSVVQYLLANGAKVNPVDSEGRTPLTFARKYGMPACARALKRAGGKDPQHISHLRCWINSLRKKRDHFSD